MNRIICIVLLLSFELSGLPQVVNDVAIKRVSSKRDTLLKKYGEPDLKFTRAYNESINLVTYTYKRMIGKAIVEKDYIKYKFNSKTGALIEKTKKWRENLPDKVAPNVTRKQAESKVKGKIMTTKLYIISPETDVFNIEPLPKNPCWIVWSRENEKAIITIIDAMTGNILGNGIPPPAFTGFAFYCDVEDGWKKWRDNADDWFEEEMGYTTRRNTCPCDATVQNWIQNDNIALFYEISHGGSMNVHQSCPDCNDLTAANIATWMTSYASMPFTFLASCDGMCDQTGGTMSFEFRKGSDTDAVAIGYCGMSGNPCSDDCWPDSRDWQDNLLSYINDGATVGGAFAEANLDFPDCSRCMRIAGDRNLIIAGEGVPRITRSYSGDLYNYEIFHISVSPLPGLPSRSNYRAYYVRDDIQVPANKVLTLVPTSTRPFIDLIIMNNSRILSSGKFKANGKFGYLMIVSETDRTKGIRIKGELVVKNGGQIRINNSF